MSLHRSWHVSNHRGAIFGVHSAKWVFMLVHTITWQSLKIHNGKFLFHIHITISFCFFFCLFGKEDSGYCANHFAFFFSFILFISCDLFDFIDIILIECNRKICFETSTINRVHIISCAFIDTRIHLCGWINFDFWFYSVVTYSPFVHLMQIQSKTNLLNYFISISVFFFYPDANTYPDWMNEWMNLRACTNVEIFRHRPSTMWCAAVDYLWPHTKMQFYGLKRIHNRNGMLAIFWHPNFDGI